MKGLLEGKVVVVTGASSGIGRAAALRFAAEGAQVIAAARSDANGQVLVEEIRSSGGAGCFICTDVADSDSIDALFAAIARDYGRLDAALNNAGILPGPAPLPDASIEDFDATFAVNVRGMWLCMRHEMRMMRAQGSGSIVNMASSAGVIGMPHTSIYCAAKHAIVGMTKSAALDYANLGIRINAICPGGVATDMTAGFVRDRMRGDLSALTRLVPMRRLAESEEVAAAAAWLLSSEAGYSTGTVMLIDGGLTVG